MSAEYEGELPEEFPPCAFATGWSQCGSRVAVVRKSLEQHVVGIYCGKGHRRKFNDGASEGHWVPHRLFAPGEPYEGVLPDWLFTFSKKRLGDGLDIPERVRRNVLLEQDRCAVCRVPPCPSSAPDKTTARWISDNIPNLARKLREELVPHAPVEADRWFAILGDGAKFEVSRAMRDSMLSADHGVPRKVLRSLGAKLTAKLAGFARSGPIFACCRACNNGRSGVLAESRNELEQMYVRAYFQNDRARFMRDAERFALFNALADLVFGQDGRVRLELVS